MQFQPAATSDCADLIGLQYRLGANGADGSIDCIHLVYVALHRMGIPTPPFDTSWYDASGVCITRALLQWGKRISNVAYDGDVLLIRQDQKAFGVAWSQGALYINQQTKRVAWCPLELLPSHYAFRYCLLSAN